VMDGASPVMDDASPVMDGASPVMDGASPVMDGASPVMDDAGPVMDGPSRPLSRPSRPLRVARGWSEPRTVHHQFGPPRPPQTALQFHTARPNAREHRQHSTALNQRRRRRADQHLNSSGACLDSGRFRLTLPEDRYPRRRIRGSTGTDAATPARAARSSAGTGPRIDRRRSIRDRRRSAARAGRRW
jgi:hypothetical protein